MIRIVLPLSLSGALLLAGGTARAVEEPAFKKVVSDGAFEVRDYPALIVAEVTVTGEQKEAANKASVCLPVTSSAATRAARASQ